MRMIKVLADTAMISIRIPASRVPGRATNSAPEIVTDRSSIDLTLWGGSDITRMKAHSARAVQLDSEVRELTSGERRYVTYPSMTSPARHVNAMGTRPSVSRIEGAVTVITKEVALSTRKDEEVARIRLAPNTAVHVLVMSP
jgi:hypothetical protein